MTSPNGNNSDSVYPQPCQSSTSQLGLPPTTETSSSSTDEEDTALAKKRRKGIVRGINLFRLSHTLSSDTKTYNFCKNLELLPKTAKCPTCKCILKRIYEVKRCGRQREEQRFQCNKKKCKSKKNQVPIRKGSWFAHARLTIRKSLLLAYCFTNKMTYDRTIQETSISSPESSSSSENGMERYLTTSKRTVADYFSYCLEICVWSVENKIHKDNKIGGIGKVVEIDKSKFGKRKYSRGRLV